MNPSTQDNLLSAQLPVQFEGIQEKYPTSEDIKCQFTLNSYKPKNGDMVAVFKTGWKSLREYILYEWVREPITQITHSVNFSRYALQPLVDSIDDLFQFCYVSRENIVQGISTPFQISLENCRRSSVLKFLNDTPQNLDLRSIIIEKDREIIRLKEENAILKESLRSVIEQRKINKNTHAEEIADLKNITGMLKCALATHQKEIDEIKADLKKERVEYHNLMLDKILYEKKYKALNEKKDSDKTNSETSQIDFDLRDLKPIPPFPF